VYPAVVFGLEADVLGVSGSVGAFPKRAEEPCPLVYVVLYLLLRDGYDLCLVAGYALEPLGEQRHALCEGDFQVPYRREVLHDPVAVALPVFNVL
jgi:hypothetical protein